MFILKVSTKKAATVGKSGSILKKSNTFYTKAGNNERDGWFIDYAQSATL